MLLDFKVSNYKSFSKKTVLSLEPAPKQKGLDYSVHRFKVGAKTYKALCSAVIYGPNAAGKTSLIGAMEAFKNIVLRGNIKDADGAGFPNKAAYSLSLIPNAFAKSARPVSFGVTFLRDTSVFEYSLEMDLGGFLEKNTIAKSLKKRWWSMVRPSSLAHPIA